MSANAEKPKRGRPTQWGEKQAKTMIRLPTGLRKIADAECTKYSYSLSTFFRQAALFYALFESEEFLADFEAKLPTGEGEWETAMRALNGPYFAKRIADRYPTLTEEEALVVVLGIQRAKMTTQFLAEMQAQFDAEDALAAEAAAVEEVSPMAKTA